MDESLPASDWEVPQSAVADPNSARLKDDGTEREYLVNVGSLQENVPEEEAGLRLDVAEGETYLSSQTYEALDGTTDAIERGSESAHSENLRFMGDLMNFMESHQVLERAMGGEAIFFDPEAERVLDEFVARGRKTQARKLSAD